MSSYIGGVIIGNEQFPIGSTLYGTCNTNADVTSKKIVLSEFDQLLDDITIHIKFIKGNTVSSNVTLQFYPSDASESPNNNQMSALTVAGNFICGTNSVISFTLDGEASPKCWRVNDTFKVEEGTTNGTIKINGEEVNVHGLGSAAYTNSNAYMGIGGGTFTGAVSGPAVSDSSASGTLATVDYVRDKTAGLSGLTGAMHFKGSTSSTVTDGGTETVTIIVDGNNVTLTPESGDVILSGNKEFVWSGSAWELLGDEGSYALKDSTGTITEVASLTNVSVGSASGWNAGGQASLTIANNTNTAASLTTNEYSIPYVTQAGTAMTAEVSQGVLTLTRGTNTTLGTAFTVKSVDEFTPNVPANITFTTNTLPQLTVTDTNVSRITTSDTTVVVPDNSNNNNS